MFQFNCNALFRNIHAYYIYTVEVQPCSHVVTVFARAVIGLGFKPSVYGRYVNFLGRQRGFACVLFKL